MHILVVDDDAIVRQTISDMLETQEWSVTAVENAIAGLAEIQQHEFDAIVCDYRLPFMGGGNFYDEVATERPASASKFLFVTGFAHDAGIGDALAATGQPVLPKPFSMDQLIAAVRQVTG